MRATAKEKQAQSDLKRRFNNEYLEGVVFAYDAESKRYRVRTDAGIETDWCRTFHHVGLQGAASINAPDQRVTVLQPKGDDENGIIMGILTDSEHNRT